MAIVGLAYLAIAPFPENHVAGTMPVYGSGVVAAQMISANLTYDRSEVTLEADNVTIESDNSITGGSLTLGVAHFYDEARKMAFGLAASKDEDGVDVLDTTAALPPYVGAGFILSEQINGVESHTANLVWKTQFAPQGISAQTKGKQKLRAYRFILPLTDANCADGFPRTVHCSSCHSMSKFLIPHWL